MRHAACLPLVAVVVLGTVAPAPAQESTRRRVEARFDRLEEVAGRRLIFFGNGESYTVPEAVYQKYQRTFLFLKRGAPVRAVIDTERRTLLGIVKRKEEERPPEPTVDPEVRAAIGLCEVGSRVAVDGARGRFLSADAEALVIEPEVEPGRFEGRRRIPLVEVRAFEVLAPPPGQEASRDDLFVREDLQVGDTIALNTGAPGQLVRLEGDRYALRTWTDGAWGPLEEGFRQTVTAVRRVSLRESLRLPLGPGGVELNLARRREGRTGALRYVLRAGHDREGMLLVGLELRFLETEDVAPDAEPRSRRQVLDLPALLPGEHETLRLRAPHADLLDGRVDVAGSQAHAVALGSPEAHQHLAPVLADPGERASRLYPALGSAEDPLLLRFLLSRLLIPGPRAGDEREHLLRGLRAAGERAIERLFQEVEGPDDQLLRVAVAEGRLGEGPLPAGHTAFDQRAARVDLLGELPESTAGPRAARLFRLSLAREGLYPRVRAVLRARPADAAAALLDLAAGADEGERASAAELLRELGRVVVAPLLAVLEAQGMDTAELRDREHTLRGEEQARGLIDLILEQRSAELTRRARAELKAWCTRRLELAEAKAESGEWAEATRVLAELLERVPRHEQALARLPAWRLEEARALHTAQENGEAALLLEAVLAHEDAELQTGARALLGTLLLEAARAEAATVVVRSHRHRAAGAVGTLAAEQVLPGEAAGEWVRVELDGGRAGFARKACLQPQPGKTWRVLHGVTPFELFRPLLDEAAQAAPELAASVADLRVQACLAEGLRRYEQGDYSGALIHFRRTRELDPEREPTAQAWRALFEVNRAAVTALAGLVFLLLTIFLFTRYRAQGKRETVAEQVIGSAEETLKKATRRLARSTARMKAFVLAEDEDDAAPQASRSRLPMIIGMVIAATVTSALMIDSLIALKKAMTE